MSVTNSEPAVREVNGRNVPEAGKYVIDASHSSVEFVARHLMITKVRGRFSEFEGAIDIAEVPEESSAGVAIKVATVSTGENQRDQHLRSADFFDAEQYPEITFQTTSVEPGKGDTWNLHGDLTVRGTTKPVVLNVEFDGAAGDPWGGQRIAFTASTELDREEWGLTWNQALETGGVLVGKKARIELNIQAVRQA
jgi:polyisoprenoid-binding protein YceI